MALTVHARDRIPDSKFAGPGRTFPIEDAVHAREAISGASRSANVGNISDAEKARIQAKARAFLAKRNALEPMKGR